MKYAIVFAVVACTLICNAWQAESPWQRVPVLWAAYAFALVACAYVTNSVRIFGKKPDGRKSLIHSLVLLPYLVLAEAIWWLNTRLSSEPPWHRIDDGLVVGRRLSARETLPPGIDSVLDLTGEFAEARHLRERNYTCLPMLDACAADAQAILATVRAVAGRPGTLYVHCAQGHGRTGMIAALILIARDPHLSPEAALARLRAIRPGIGLSRWQRETLDAVAKSLGNASLQAPSCCENRDGSPLTTDP